MNDLSIPFLEFQLYDSVLDAYFWLQKLGREAKAQIVKLELLYDSVLEAYF